MLLFLEDPTYYNVSVNLLYVSKVCTSRLQHWFGWNSPAERRPMPPSILLSFGSVLLPYRLTPCVPLTDGRSEVRTVGKRSPDGDVRPQRITDPRAMDGERGARRAARSRGPRRRRERERERERRVGRASASALSPLHWRSFRPKGDCLPQCAVDRLTEADDAEADDAFHSRTLCPFTEANSIALPKFGKIFGRIFSL